MAFDVIRNPEVFIDRKNSKVLHDDESWQFYAPADGCKAGDVDLQRFRNFFPYIAQAEVVGDNPLGVIPWDIALSPYDSDLNWIDESFSPNFRGEYNYNCVAGNSWTENFPSPSGVMLSWGQDWFNNQYGIYKSGADGLSIYDRRELSGQFWVRNPNRQVVAQGETALAGIANNYTWHSTLSAHDFDGGLVDVRVYNDILFMRTPTHALVERIRLDAESNVFSLVDESAVLSYEGAFPEPYFKDDALYFTSFSADSLDLYRYKDNLQRLASSTSAVSANSEGIAWDDCRNTWVSARVEGDSGILSHVEFRGCVDGYDVSSPSAATLTTDHRLIDFDYVQGDPFYIIEEQTTPAVFVAADQMVTTITTLSGLDACSASENVTTTSEETTRVFRPLALHYHNLLRDFDNSSTSGVLVGVSALEGALDANLRQNSINILTQPLSSATPGGEAPFVRQGGEDRDVALQYLITASLSSTSATGQWSLPYHAIPLKSLQNNEYQYTCIDDVRDYHALHFGVKGIPYDRPIFGYSSNYRTQVFEPDTETKFVYPHNATARPLTASTLACDGGIPGSCPSNSDIIAHRSTMYRDSANIYYSWLSGDNCNTQWVDRILQNMTALDGEFGDGFGGGFWSEGSSIPDNFYEDVTPSVMQLVPGDEYCYLRRGRELNNAYLEGLSSSLVFSIDGIFGDTALDSSGNGFDSPVTK